MANVLTLFLDAMYAPEPDDDDSLSHHGVPGMKWGEWNDETRRKYTGGTGRQRRGVESMSLTPAQERREARRQQKSSRLRNLETKKSVESNTKRSQQQSSDPRNHEIKKSIEGDTNRREANTRGVSGVTTKPMRENTPKKLSEMSDAELNNAINRLRNEKTYKELMAERNSMNQVKKKKEPGKMETALRGAARDAVATTVRTGLTKGGTMLVNYAIDQSLGKKLDAKKAAQSKAAFDKFMSGIDTETVSSSKFKNQAENLSRSIDLEKKYPGLISYLGGGAK